MKLRILVIALVLVLLPLALDSQIRIKGRKKTRANAPTAPSSLTATAGSQGVINVAWTDNATNEDGVTLERCTGTAAVCAADTTQFAVLSELPQNATAYANTGLTDSTTYSYRVKAFNSVGASAYSNIDDATTIATPSTLAFYFKCDFEDGTLCGFLPDVNGDGQCVNTAGAGVGGSRAIVCTASSGSVARIRRSIPFTPNPPYSNPAGYGVAWDMALDTAAITCCDSTGQMKLARTLGSSIGQWETIGHGREFPSICSSNPRRWCFVQDQGIVFLFGPAPDIVAGQFYHFETYSLRSGGSGTEKFELDTVLLGSRTNSLMGWDGTIGGQIYLGIVYKQNTAAGTKKVTIDNVWVANAEITP